MIISKEEYDKLPKRLQEFFSKGNIHPTCKSLKLFSWLITLGSREGDIILDPFCGSGTTPIAAVLMGRKYIGIDMTEEYVQIARARVEVWKKEMEEKENDN